MDKLLDEVKCICTKCGARTRKRPDYAVGEKRYVNLLSKVKG